MPTLAELALAFVALYPIVTAALWVADGVLFHPLDQGDPELPDEWPGVIVLIPAYNEEAVIATSVGAALAVALALGARRRPPRPARVPRRPALSGGVLGDLGGGRAPLPATALIRGPRERRVVWDIEREGVEADAEAVAPPR